MSKIILNSNSHDAKGKEKAGFTERYELIHSLQLIMFDVSTWPRKILMKVSYKSLPKDKSQLPTVQPRNNDCLRCINNPHHKTAMEKYYSLLQSTVITKPNNIKFV